MREIPTKSLPPTSDRREYPHMETDNLTKLSGIATKTQAWSVVKDHIHRNQLGFTLVVIG